MSFSLQLKANDTTPSYKDVIKQLAAQAPEPYGTIPPRMKRKKKKKPTLDHVENWIAVDSKESLPDEQDLVYSSPSSNFLSANFLVLPLHMPPPSLSKNKPVIYSSVITDDDEEEEEDDDDDEEEEEEEEEYRFNKTLKKKISIPSFSSKSHEPSTSTTTSYAISPPPTEEHTSRWKDTIAQLRRSLTLNRKIVPLPPPPLKQKKKRRSEATTQPRFNPETNTYTRDTRSNPDHLRMISAELNMMRHRKLSSPLKPRGFLPRRTDVFVRGEGRKISLLRYEVV